MTSAADVAAAVFAGQLGRKDALPLVPSFAEQPGSQSGTQMIRYRHDRDPLVAIEQQKCPNELRSVVMQQVVIPMAFHQFWDQHGDVAIRPLDLLLDSIVDDRLDDEAIGRIKYNQSRLRKT